VSKSEITPYLDIEEKARKKLGRNREDAFFWHSRQYWSHLISFI
jgi:hypothetical protein